MLWLIWFSLFVVVVVGCCCYLTADEALTKKFLKHIKYLFAAFGGLKVESKTRAVSKEAFKKQERLRILFLYVSNQDERTNFWDRRTDRVPWLEASIWVTCLGGTFIA